MSVKITRYDYAGMYGPTKGDKIRLADTELFIEVEKDLTTYGDEVKFGGGKTIRDGMGQSQRPSSETVDLVITNAVIIDYWGIVKADVGIKNGRIFAVGKAGNPDTQSGVDIITNKREIETTVLVDNNQIIVLGGLIDEDVQEVVSKVPVLGSIPLLGRLFHSSSTSTSTKNLMVFLKPTILTDSDSANEISLEKYNYIKAEQQLKDNIIDLTEPKD